MTKLSVVELEFGDEEVVAIDLDDLIPIGEDVSAEFTNQASSYAYVAVLAARAEALWLGTKADLKKAYAEADHEARLDLLSLGKKPTEPMVKQEVELRSDYRDAVDEELFYHEQHLIARVIEQSMKMRADMLVSLGAQLRNEAQQLGMNTKRQVESIKRRRTS